MFELKVLYFAESTIEKQLPRNTSGMLNAWGQQSKPARQLTDYELGLRALTDATNSLGPHPEVNNTLRVRITR